MSSKHVRCFTFLCCSILLLPVVLIPVPARGQAISTGTIQGVVTDPTGAAIVGATVTLTNTATSTSRTAVTNDVGRFLFADIPPAKYDISISKSGFRVVRFQGQELTVGATLTLDSKLEV